MKACRQSPARNIWLAPIVAVACLVLGGAVSALPGAAYGRALGHPRASVPLHWAAVNAVNPPAGEAGSSFAYDPATKDIVMFGGEGIKLDNETWTLSGSTWTDTHAEGPPARYFASMAFDAPLNEMVLFGGFGENNGGYRNDTWAWNGKTWTELSPTVRPPARNEASMVYDSSTKDLVLFGGEGVCGTACDDTWVFNGTTWTQAIDPGCTSACPSSPPALALGSMAYDPSTQDVVLFGGEDQTTNDVAGTWTWNGSAWTDMGADPGLGNLVPAGLYEGAMAYDASTGNLVLFGGAGLFWDVSTTSVWNGSVWTQVIDPTDHHGCTQNCPKSPSGRVAGGLAYDPQNGEVVLFGGVSPDQSALNDTWYWGTKPKQVTSTKLRSSASPVARGETVTYTATTGPNPVGGTVKFSDGASVISGCAAQPVNVSTGVATCHAVYHTTGMQKVRAVFSGTTAFDVSTSSVLSEKVTAFGAAKKLVVVTKPPKSAIARHRFTLAVSVEDAWGNVVTSDRTSRVQLAIRAGTGTAGAKLACSSDPVAVSGGVAKYGCSINKPGTGFELIATSSRLARAISGRLRIT